MSSQPLDRGPPVLINLFFDGSASPNPGPAAWGAVAIIKTRKHTKTLQWSAPIGHATNNIAEYLALIAGLRRVINHLQSQSIRHSYVHLVIRGDSKLVIDQLTARCKVKSDTLAPLHHLAGLLISRFLDADLDICSREQNVKADRLANHARQQAVSSSNKAIFYPALVNFVDVWVEGLHTLASHDLGTAGADPTCFVDATFLHNLPEGQVLFRSIRDPHPLSIVIGKVNMTVLGTISLDIGVCFSRRPNGQPYSQPQRSNIVDVVVVHSLPVPFHVSHRNPYIGKPDEWVMTGQVKFSGETLPEPYGEHRYWHSDTMFLGIEDSSVMQTRNVLSVRQLQEAGQLDEQAIASLALQ